MLQAAHRELDVRRFQQRIALTGIQAQGVVFIRTSVGHESAHISDVQLLRLPWRQACVDLFGKTRGISRSTECFFRHNG